MFGSIFLKDDQLQRGLINAERSGQRTTGVLGHGFGQVGQAAAGLGSKIGGVAVAMGGLVGIAVGVGAAVAGVVHVGSEYTKQMSKVEALSRSNGLQMAELGANARKLGADTRWSATNVAEAYEYMALAGWDSNQMIAASKPLLDLATAGALDLAKASDIVTDTMTPFGMKASEAGRAADVFALAQATANLNVEQLGETMKYAAPVAATFGLNLEETSVIAQIFANNGIKASMAGTALRAGLSRLAAPPKEAAKSLSALNVTVKDSQGNMKPMNEIIGQLHDGFGKLSESQQIAAAKAIFGEEAYAGWIQVIKGGKPAFDDMLDTLNSAEGSAKVMAETMANNLSGAVDGVKSQLENLGLVVFSHVEPALVAMTNGTNSAVKSLTDWLDPSGRAVEAAKLMQQTDQQLAQSKTILDMNLKKGKITQEEYNEKLALSKKHAEDMMNADGMLAQKKEELKMKVAEGSMTQEEANKILDQSEVEYQKLQQGIEQTKKRQEAFTSVLKPFREVFSSLIKGISESLGSLGNQFNEIKNIIVKHFSEIMRIFEKHKDGIMKILVFLFNNVLTAINNVLKIIGSVLDTSLTFFRNTIDLFWSLLTGDWASAWESFKNLTSDLIKGLGNIIAALWDASILKKLVTLIKDGAISIGNALLDWGIAIKDWFISLPSNIVQWLPQWWDAISSWITSKASEWKSKLFTWGTTIKDWFLDLPSNIGNWLSYWWNSISTWITSKASEWGFQLLAWGIAIKNWFISLPGNIAEWISNWWNTILNWLVEKQTAWSLQLSLWGTAIQEWFSSLPEIISQKLTEWWNAISTWFESTKESWKTKLDEWNTTIGEWFEKLPGNIYNWLLNVSQILEQWNNEQIQKIIDDFNTWWASIEEWFNSTKENWTTKLNEWGAIISNWWESIPSRITEWFNGWWNPISEWYDSTKTQIENKLNEWGNSISAWWESIPGRISDWFTNWWNSMSNWYDETKGNIENKLSDWGNSISNWFNTRPAEIRNSLNEWWNSMGKWWDETKQNITDKLEGWWQVIKDWFNQVPEKPEIKNAGKNMIDRMTDGANSKEGDFTEKLGKLILKVIGLVLLAIAIGLFSAGKELIKLILEGVDAARGWMVDKFKEVGKWAIDSISSIDWAGMGKKLINWIIDGISGMAGELGSAFSRLFKGIHIPTPKFSVSGSLNPVDWASGGLPSIGVKWAANGALIKPGNPTLIGVGDARGYDETVLPLRNQTFDAIANGIMGSLPLTQQAGAQQYASQGPTILQVNLNGREIAKEIYSDVSKFQESEKERLKVF